MDTSEIRELVRWIWPSHDLGARGRARRLESAGQAIERIADALDELDERTRGEVMPDPPPDTCDCGICSEERQGVSTIPGCYCRECVYRSYDDINGAYECLHHDTPWRVIGAALRYALGCTLGERIPPRGENKEAE